MCVLEPSCSNAGHESDTILTISCFYGTHRTQILLFDKGWPGIIIATCKYIILLYDTHDACIPAMSSTNKMIFNQPPGILIYCHFFIRHYFCCWSLQVCCNSRMLFYTEWSMTAISSLLLYFSWDIFFEINLPAVAVGSHLRIIFNYIIYSFKKKKSYMVNIYDSVYARLSEISEIL